MAKLKNRQFWESAKFNNSAFMKYYNRLLELAISMFEWKNIEINFNSMITTF